MPPYSTLRTFINSLRTGETNITRSLETVTNNAALRQDHAGDINSPPAFAGQFPGWLRRALAGAGMKPQEIAHIESWPPPAKDVVRQQVAHALTDGRTLLFRWEVHEGANPESHVHHESAAEALVVFRSPRSGVHLSALNFGSVRVEA